MGIVEDSQQSRRALVREGTSQSPFTLDLGAVFKLRSQESLLVSESTPTAPSAALPWFFRGPFLLSPPEQNRTVNCHMFVLTDFIKCRHKLI